MSTGTQREGALVQWLKLPAWKAGFNPTLSFKFQRNKMFLLCSLVMIQYCGEPPWPGGSVLDVWPPWLEFRILCLEGSVISFISPSSAGSPGPSYPICARRSPKTNIIFTFSQAHKVVAGLNQRHWRWFNVAITSCAQWDGIYSLWFKRVPVIPESYATPGSISGS